jgi:undecaprenyl-diphosphatase
METTTAAASMSSTSSEGCVGHVHTAPPFTPSSVLLRRRRLLIALGALLVALATAAALGNGQALLTWDEPIQRGVEANRTSALNDLFLILSRLGSTVVVLVLGTLGVILTWRRCRAVATALLVATFARPAIEFVVKGLVSRDRPDFDRLVAGTGYSFPSGHVMAAIALWGLLPVVVALYTRRRGIWWASVAVSATLIAGISASRVYLGVHWFSDVTAGLVVGTFFLLGMDKVLIRAHRRYPCRMLAEQAEQAEQAQAQQPQAEPVERPERVRVGSGV